MATDAVSDLLFGFQQMQADDHECLVKRFCELIPGSMPTNAQFYLESFNWSVSMKNIVEFSKNDVFGVFMAYLFP